MKKNCSDIKLLFKVLTYFILIICTSIFPTISFCQEDSNEELFELDEEISDGTDNYELLYDLKQNPIDINKSTPEQLIIIPGIQYSTALKICNHRDRTGGYLNLDEMKKVLNLNDEIFQKLKQFVYVGRDVKWQKVGFEIRSRVINPMEESRGFVEGRYFDSKIKQYNRMTFNYGENVKAGVLFEKDSGENRFNDYQSFFVELNNILNLKKIVLGNYKMEFGEGLAFWNSYGFGKGGDGIYPIKKKGRGILGYKSVFENGGFFGLSASGKVNFMNYYLFYSSRRIDANENEFGQITSLFDSGLHRSESESLKKDILDEVLYGVRLEFNIKQKGVIGITHYQTDYNKEFIKSERDFYRFNGRNNNLFAMDFKYYFSKMNFFGEIARSKNGGIGAVTGTVFDFDNTTLGVVFRNYDENFYSSYSRGFSEISYENRNERGIYLGLNHRINSKLRLYGYFDQFWFPWRTYYIPLPSSGYDEMVRLIYKKSTKTNLEIKIRNNKEDASIKVKDEKGNEKSKLGEYQRISMRFQIDRMLTERIKFRWRAEGIFESKISIEKEYNYDYNDKGILNYFDFEITSIKDINVSFRYTYFTSKKSTISFYQFERDLPDILNISRLYGTGNEFYCLVKYRVKSLIDIALKYSIVKYPGAAEIGSGYDEIKGNTKRYLSCQIRVFH